MPLGEINNKMIWSQIEFNMESTFNIVDNLMVKFIMRQFDLIDAKLD